MVGVEGRGSYTQTVPKKVATNEFLDMEPLSWGDKALLSRPPKENKGGGNAGSFSELAGETVKKKRIRMFGDVSEKKTCCNRMGGVLKMSRFRAPIQALRWGGRRGTEGVSLLKRNQDKSETCSEESKRHYQ